jgi:hypothetical protein
MVMEVLERSLKDERGLWLRMRKKKEKFEGYRVENSGTAVPPIGTGRATYWHGPCQPFGVGLVFGFTI